MLRMAVRRSELAARELEAQTEARGDRQAELRDGRCGGGVFHVEEVFGGREELDACADRAPGHRVENEEAAERKHVLVVVKLFSDHAPVHGNIDARGVQVASLKGEDVMRNLSDP